MTNSDSPFHQPPSKFLLADDDNDDRFFFRDVLSKVSPSAELTTVGDGEELMKYLFDNSHQLPDVLFLDINMPRKNGKECLIEIRADEKLKHLPIIIYSTSLPEIIADELFAIGANKYLRKTNLIELKEKLRLVLSQLAEDKFPQTTKENFSSTY